MPETKQCDVQDKVGSSECCVLGMLKTLHFLANLQHNFFTLEQHPNLKLRADLTFAARGRHWVLCLVHIICCIFLFLLFFDKTLHC